MTKKKIYHIEMYQVLVPGTKEQYSSQYSPYLVPLVLIPGTVSSTPKEIKIHCLYFATLLNVLCG